MAEEKKPFSDPRWTQPIAERVIGFEEVTEEEKRQLEEWKRKDRERKEKKKSEK